MIEKADGEMNTIDSIDEQIAALEAKKEEILANEKKDAVAECKRLIKKYGLTYSQLKTVLPIRQYNKKT